MVNLKTKRMMNELEQDFAVNHPDAGFSVSWNQIECIAHLIKLGAQENLKNFKQPIDPDTYDINSGGCN